MYVFYLMSVKPESFNEHFLSDFSTAGTRLGSLDVSATDSSTLEDTMFTSQCISGLVENSLVHLWKPLVPF